MNESVNESFNVCALDDSKTDWRQAIEAGNLLEHAQWMERPHEQTGKRRSMATIPNEHNEAMLARGPL